MNGEQEFRKPAQNSLNKANYEMTILTLTFLSFCTSTGKKTSERKAA